MDPEYIINRDDIGTRASSSLSSPLLSIRGGGGEEQQETISNSEFETTQTNNSTRCNYCCYGWFYNIPTLVYILVPMILIFIAMFLAAAFIPPHHTN